MNSRRLVHGCLLALVAVLVAPAATGLAAPSKPAASVRTSVDHLKPVTSKGQLKPGYSVGHTFSFASCSAGSESTGNAYRCFAGKSNHSLNRVLDPCWAESRQYVVCLQNPWSFTVTELTVTKGFHNAGRTTKHAKLPWGVQLRNGTQCGYLQGAGAAVGGKRVNYGCANSKLVLYGAVNRQHKVWTIRSGVPTRSGFTKHGRAKLGVAWFGQPSAKG